jgi:hypothetical protein
VLSRAASKCEFGFCRKGLSRSAEFQLAVRYQPVYNPALRRYGPDYANRLRPKADFGDQEASPGFLVVARLSSSEGG